MSTPEKRFREVSKSEFPHEREGLGLLVAAVPNTAPYRVWTNFSFTDDQGQWHEVDALVVGRGRIHMVELKSWNGVFSGSEHQIDIAWDSGGRAQKRHPNYTTRKKAQKFVGRLHREIDDIRKHAGELGIPMSHQDYYVPWVQECLFLHGDRVQSRLSDSGAHNVFGRDGMEVDATKGLVDEHAAFHIMEPSDADARQIMDFWRAVDDEGELLHLVIDPDAADPLSTRFLGDMYEDLSVYAQKKWALKQTPELVEKLILQRTTVPALAERPLEGFTMIDPAVMRKLALSRESVLTVS